MTPDAPLQYMDDEIDAASNDHGKHPDRAECLTDTQDEGKEEGNEGVEKREPKDGFKDSFGQWCCGLIDHGF